jgi:hypothetical protein
MPNVEHRGQSHPLSPPACQRITYINVANGRKMRPSRGQIQVLKAASTITGLAIQMMNRPSRGKSPANMANRHPIVVPFSKS